MVKAVEDAEEPDCAVQDATEELHKMQDNDKKQIGEGVTEESTELCDKDANEPKMEKAEDSEVPRGATQTTVKTYLH